MSRVRGRQPPLAIPDSLEEIYSTEDVDVQLSKMRNNFNILESKYAYLISDNGYFTSEYYTDVLARKLPITFENAEIKQAVFTDGGGELISRDVTGRGKVVMDHNPFGHGIWTIPHIRNLDNDLLLQEDGLQDIDCFGASAAGSTPALTVSGYRAADALRTLSISVGATVANQVDFTGLATYYFGGAITATGGIVPGGNITMADDEWIGLGGAAGRLVFDATPAPDALNFQNCDVNMFNNSVLGETPLLSIYGWAAFGALRSLEISCGSIGDDLAYFNGVSNYGFNGDIVVYGNGIFDSSFGNWILSDGALNTTLGGDLFVSNGSLGVGTATVPHGGVGAGIVAIEGTNASVAAGPHMQFTTASDDYPLMQILPWQHGDVYIVFDAYYDGGYKSSDAGSNFILQKASSDIFRIRYDSGNAQGAGVGWNTAVELDTSGDWDFQAGNLTTSGNITASGTGVGSFGADTDTVHVMGRARIGFNGSNDFAVFAHYDHMNLTDYAFAGGPAGQTIFNAAAGQWIDFRINSVQVGRFDAASFEVANNSITDAGGAWLDSDGAGNTTAQGNLTTTGHLGVDIAAATDRTLYVSDTALSTITTYYNVHSVLTKTAGVTDAGDDIFGIYSATEMNQNGATIGELWGITSATTLTDGTAGGDFTGVNVLSTIAGGTVGSDMMGINCFVDGNGGTVLGNLRGMFIDVDLEAAMASIAGSVMGLHIQVDADQDPTGSAYGIFLTCLTNVDYGIYQGGAAVTNYFEGNLHGSGSLILDDNLEAGDGFITAIAARAAEDSIIGQFHVFVTPSDVDHDYFALGDKVDGQVIMITNDGAVIANVDQDVAITGFTLCINETALARWHSADSAWYIVRG